ncbi:MAG: hypothetical protein Q4D54_09285 [Eubacteriales bacterium]|nr:hypothetical protein [Eubacteriales bacterium]
MEHYGYDADELLVSAADAITPDIEPVVIISAWNTEGDITDGIHTYCLTVDENGKYVAHNAYNLAELTEGAESQQTFNSVGEFIDCVNTAYSNEPVEVFNIVGVRE